MTGLPVTNDSNHELVSVRVPGSTSNLGAGFDCFGLALQIYLTVEARCGTDAVAQCKVITQGEGANELPRNADNLIFRAMQFVADKEKVRLPALELVVHNQLPLGRGLGSSAAAIVAGMVLARSICKIALTDQQVLQHALELEGHADNLASAFYGGLTITCLKNDSGLLVHRKAWPPELDVVVVSPHVQLPTAEARRVLGATVRREDAVFNLQRTALFISALDSGNYDLLWEAMQDRLHQYERRSLVPGLTNALATKRQPGLFGLALSGSGPSVVAITREGSQLIGEKIAANFREQGIDSTVRVFKADSDGYKLSTSNQRLPMNHLAP